VEHPVPFISAWGLLTLRPYLDGSLAETGAPACSYICTQQKVLVCVLTRDNSLISSGRRNVSTLLHSYKTRSICFKKDNKRFVASRPLIVCATVIFPHWTSCSYQSPLNKLQLSVPIEQIGPHWSNLQLPVPTKQAAVISPHSKSCSYQSPLNKLRLSVPTETTYS
jgi:hypothetical protein